VGTVVADAGGLAADGFAFFAEAAGGLGFLDVGGGEGNFAFGVAYIDGNGADLFGGGLGSFEERPSL
jgi:hypothetical protein